MWTCTMTIGATRSFYGVATTMGGCQWQAGDAASNYAKLRHAPCTSTCAQRLLFFPASGHVATVLGAEEARRLQVPRKTPRRLLGSVRGVQDHQLRQARRLSQQVSSTRRLSVAWPRALLQEDGAPWQVICNAPVTPSSPLTDSSSPSTMAPLQVRIMRSMDAIVRLYATIRAMCQRRSQLHSQVLSGNFVCTKSLMPTPMQAHR